MKRNVLLIIASLVTSLVLIIVFDLAAWSVVQMMNKGAMVSEDNEWRIVNRGELVEKISLNSEMHFNSYGYIFKPNEVITQTLRKGDKLFYESRYTINKYGFRATGRDESNKRKNAVIFLGCSFTFGQGLNDNETLAWLVHANVQNYDVYNWALPAMGPNQASFLIRDMWQKQDFSQYEQIKIVYVFLNFHYKRSLAKYSWQSNMPTMPWYSIEDGKLVYRGQHQNRDDFWGKLMKYANHSWIFHKFNIDLPPFELSTDKTLFKLVLHEMKKAVTEKIKAENFAFVAHPLGIGAFDRELMDLPDDEFRRGIFYRDYSLWFEQEHNIEGKLAHKFVIHKGIEDHANGLLNELFAKKLIADLKLD